MALASVALLQATITLTHILIVVLVLVLLFGAERIPKLMRNMGTGLSEFKKGLKEGVESEQAKSDPTKSDQAKPDEAKKDQPSPKP